ncbi:hypothetical protein LWX53_03300 [bacterium]|nr:hypothetical protein [bacterium]
MARPRFSSSEDVFDYLMEFVNVEKGQKTEFKLDRMLFLSALLGNPHLGRLTIHVAGSKGKGSVSTMAAGILGAAGLKTGLYTSPHLLRWKERIALSNGEMPEATLIAAMEEILPFVEGKPADFFPGAELPTYFELTTLVAFCAFRAEGCAAQVIETGMGGRLDSTNIVDPDVSAITPIELEHTQFLGDTIGKIAFEKAGIIKKGKPVCLARQKGEALAVFRARAAESESALRLVGAAIDAEDARVAPSGTSCRLVAGPDAWASLKALLSPAGLEVHSPIIGAIQAQNMALAAMAAACALPGLKPADLVRGLAAARLPARFELVRADPPVVLDGAHTPESIRLAADTARSLFPGPKVLLFACAYDKRHAEMAAILAPHFEAIVVTKPGTFKASDPKAVYASFAALRPDARLEEDTAAALALAAGEAEARGAALLVTGSFYLCAEAKTFFA